MTCEKTRTDRNRGIESIYLRVTRRRNKILPGLGQDKLPARLGRFTTVDQRYVYEWGFLLSQNGSYSALLSFRRVFEEKSFILTARFLVADSSK